MKKVLVKIILIVVTCSASSVVNAADSKWSEGAGQGNLEYSIEVGKLKLNVDCPTENGSSDRPSSISMSLNGKDLNTFELSVNGKKYSGPIETGNRVGNENFIELLEDLKKSDAKVNLKEGSVVIPKSNAQTVLPTYGKKGFYCNLDVENQIPVEKTKIDRPPHPSTYGRCYGALMAQMKQTGGRLASQKAVDFYNAWSSYAKQNTAVVNNTAGCKGNLSDSQLLACYSKIFPDRRDADFQFKANLGYEEVIEKPSSAANLTIANICGSLIGVKQAEGGANSNAKQSSATSGTGVITRVDTSTGNVFMTGFSPWVPTSRSTSITVNGNQVRNEGDLIPGDKCIVRREATDLYARNLICTR